MDPATAPQETRCGVGGPPARRAAIRRIAQLARRSWVGPHGGLRMMFVVVGAGWSTAEPAAIGLLLYRGNQQSLRGPEAAAMCQ
jgi:hypothetical protein